MTIKLKAINQALALLAASGAEYAVRYDGKDYGNSKIADPVTEPRVIKYRWADIYLEWVKTAKPGDVFSHTVPTKEEAISLRGSISSRLCVIHGQGTFITSLDECEGGFKVEALLISSTLATLVPPEEVVA